MDEVCGISLYLHYNQVNKFTFTKGEHHTGCPDGVTSPEMIQATGFLHADFGLANFGKMNAVFALSRE